MTSLLRFKALGLRCNRFAVEPQYSGIETQSLGIESQNFPSESQSLATEF